MLPINSLSLQNQSPLPSPFARLCHSHVRITTDHIPVLVCGCTYPGLGPRFYGTHMFPSSPLTSPHSSSSGHCKDSSLSCSVLSFLTSRQHTHLFYSILSYPILSYPIRFNPNPILLSNPQPSFYPTLNHPHHISHSTPQATPYTLYITPLPLRQQDLTPLSEPGSSHLALRPSRLQRRLVSLARLSAVARLCQPLPASRRQRVGQLGRQGYSIS